MLKKLAPALALTIALANSAFALNTNDLLSLVAMPLAVAAVSNVTGVPQQDLTNVVSALNQGNVAPTQFVEVVRYTPVVLTNQTNAPVFVDYVTTQVNQGVTGDALATAIANQVRSYGAPQTNVTAPPPQVIVEQRDFVPPVVMTRVEEVRQHPHGGPPGQLKKIVGVQTGAEIVHGEKPGRQVPTPMMSGQPAPVAKEKNKGEGHGRGRGNAEQQQQVVAPPAAAPAPVEVQQQPGRGKGNDQGGPPGQAKDKEKGKGKDKGKGN